MRHGQCEGGDSFRGHIDVALTPEGYTLMCDRLLQEADQSWQRIVTSPKQRCYNFAKATAERLSIPLHIEDDLREIHFGDWEGQDILHIWETERATMEAWHRDPSTNAPPNGETFNDFSHRVEAAMTRIVSDFGGERTLIITHGGIIRLLLSLHLPSPAKHMSTHSVPYGYYETLPWSILNPSE